MQHLSRHPAAVQSVGHLGRTLAANVGPLTTRRDKADMKAVLAKPTRTSVTATASRWLAGHHRQHITGPQPGSGAAAPCCVAVQCKAHLDVALEISRRPLKLGLEVVLQQKAGGLPYLPSQYVPQPGAMQNAAADPGPPILRCASGQYRQLRPRGRVPLCILRRAGACAAEPAKGCFVQQAAAAHLNKSVCACALCKDEGQVVVEV